MEKAMAPHSSNLAWKIPWTEEPGRLQSMGSLRVGHDWSDFTFTFHFHALEKEMATHSSVLAWRIPGMAEPGGLPSMGSHRVGHDWSDLAAAAAAAEISSRKLEIPREHFMQSSIKRLIKDRNGMDLTEAEDIKKRWQEYTEELYKRDSWPR